MKQTSFRRFSAYLKPGVVLLSAVLLASACEQNTGFGVIVGSVTDSVSSTPLAGVTITTEPATETVITDDQGSFLIADVAVGTYVVSASLEGYETASETVEVSEGVENPVGFVLAPASSTTTSTAGSTTTTTVVPGVPAYQNTSWISTGGPYGGLGYDVRMQPDNPDIMYVTDDGAGAFKSTDGGENWFAINNGIVPSGDAGDNYSVFCLTIDPNDYNRIWIGSALNSHVYRSDDKGATWEKKMTGIQEQFATFRGFAVEPGNSDVVYLAGEVWSMEWNNGVELGGLEFDRTKGVVYKSEDGGENWTRIWYGDNLARYVWIDPDDHKRIFVSTGIFDREAANSDPVTKTPGGVGILRSTDGGQTWEELDEKNGLDADELYIGTLYMHPEDSDFLLAGADNAPFNDDSIDLFYGGVYLTEDGGDTWTEVLDQTCTSVEICEGDPDIAYAIAGGVQRSTDSGKTWTVVDEHPWGPPGVNPGTAIDIQCDPRDSDRLFVNGYGGGNFVSEDGGKTWKTASRGYTGARMADIALAADDSGLVYASGRTGVFMTTNGGADWLGRNYENTNLERGGVAVDPTDSSHAFLLSSAPEEPVETTDGGLTWTVVATGFTDTTQTDVTRMIADIIYSPRDAKTLFGLVTNHGTWMGGELGVDGDGGGIIVSRDSGKTWTATGLTTGNAVSLAIHPDTGGPLYASVSSKGLYRSDDDGETWTRANANPLNAADTKDIHFYVAVDPADRNYLVAGFHNNGIALSSDGGTTWTASSSGMSPETNVVEVVFDAANPGVVYACSTNAGVFYSTDKGLTWQALNDGLSVKAVVKLELSADGSVLYAATIGGGVFRLGTPSSP